MDALSLYGSLTADQRRWLLDGMGYGLLDLTEPQHNLLASMMLDAPTRFLIDDSDGDRIFTDPANPEITQLIDGLQTPEEHLTMATRTETVVRVQGIGPQGNAVDEILSLGETAQILKNQGPWQSISYASGPANTIKFTLQVSKEAQVVRFVRDYPRGFSVFGPLNSLPADVQLAIATPTKSQPTLPKKAPGKKH
jgi:hypothetical protein